MLRVRAVVTVAALVATTVLLGSGPVMAWDATAPDGGLLTFLPVGDSITDGNRDLTSCPPAQAGDGYRFELARDLNDAGNIFVQASGDHQSGCHGDTWNAGHGGYTIAQVDGLIRGGLLDNPPPSHRPVSYVLLHVGINDAVTGRTAEQMLTGYTTLLDDILAHDPTVRVVSSTLIEPDGRRAHNLAAGSATVRRFNRALPALVASRGNRVRLVDMSIIASRDLDDGLHPNFLGYQKMAYLWYRVLASWLLGPDYPEAYCPFDTVPVP